MKKQFFLVALAIAGLLGWYLLLRGPGSVAELPDGTVLRLVGATMGTNQLVIDRPWYRLARQILPTRYQSWIPRRRQVNRSFSGRLAAYTNMTTVWLEVWDPASRTNLIKKWERLESVNKYGETQTHWEGPSSASGGRPECAYDLRNFPRRQSHFLLRFYETNNPQPVVLRVPNLYHSPFPKWVPDQMPAAKTNGDLTVVYKGIKQVLKESSPGKTNMLLEPDFDYFWKGAPSSEWLMWDVGFWTDATGNYSYRGNELSFHEPAWKLQAWFHRADDSSFADHERFTLTNLPVLSPSAFTNLDIHTNVQGLGLWLISWSGPASLRMSNGHVFEASMPENKEAFRPLSQAYTSNNFFARYNLGGHSLMIAHEHDEPDWSVGFVFRDELGHSLVTAKKPERLYLPLGVPGKGRFFVRVGQPEIPPGVKSVSAEIIVQRRRSLEFLVAPPRR